MNRFLNDVKVMRMMIRSGVPLRICAALYISVRLLGRSPLPFFQIEGWDKP